MTKAMVIARRELASYFFSPMAYVVMTLFLFVTGILFWRDFVPGEVAGMRMLFDWMMFLLVLAAPILTMSLLAQELATGTLETLMTSPISEIDVVIGKFVGSFGFLLVLLCPTLVYVVMLAIYSRPGLDPGPIISGYVGIILVGAMFVSVGLFCSALTRSQMIAAVAAAAILFLVTVLPMLLLQNTALAGALRSIAEFMVYQRYTDFSRGVIDTGHIIFFVASTAVFLFLSVKAVELRRWK